MGTRSPCLPLTFETTASGPPFPVRTNHLRQSPADSRSDRARAEGHRFGSCRARSTLSYRTANAASESGLKLQCPVD